MFAKFVGKRTTALATSLAVVVGLVITPAFAANATEAPPAEPAPVVEVVEAPAAEPVTPPAPVVEALPAPVVETPPAEPVETPTPPAEAPAPLAELVEASAPPVEPTPLVEPVETATPQNQMRNSTMGAQSMGAQSFGVQSTGILPVNIPDQIMGQPMVPIQFSAPGAEWWEGAYIHSLFGATTLSADGKLTGKFNSPGTHYLSVTAKKNVWVPPVIVWGFEVWPGRWEETTIAQKTYEFDVKPAILTNTLDDATVGAFYTEQLDGTLIGGYFTSNTFSLTNGSSLPDGLSLSASGVISGVPTDLQANPETHTFDVKLSVWNVLSGTHRSAAKTLSITVGYPAPTWNSITLPEATVGDVYPTTTISANGNGWAVGSYTASGLPDGLSLSPAGVISGTPLPNSSYGPIETVAVSFTADNGLTTSVNASIIVKSPPTLATTSPLPNAVVGTPYATTITSTGPAVTYSLVKHPSGMVIDSATGAISGWTPSIEGNTSIRVKVENAAGSVEQRYVIKAFEVPTISTTTLVHGVVGQSYSDQIVFDGRNARLTKASGTLPNGVSLKRGTASNGAGVLSGTPTREGVFTFTVEVANPSGTTSRTFEIRVHDVPVIHVTNLARGFVGQAYTDSVQFSGLDAKATLLRGALPTGLTLNLDGTFAGSPTETGVFGFVVKVSNPAGSVKHRYRIVTFDVPVILTGGLDQGIVGMAYNQHFAASGHGVKFVVPRTSTLPPGLTLDRDGLLHGTPTVAGDFTFDVRARNAAGKSVQSFTLTVTAPAMTLSTDKVIRGNSVTVNGSGYLPGDSLELWLHSTPVLLGTVTAADGTFTRTVVIPANTAAGAHHLVVVGAQSGTQSVPLTVALPAAAPQATTPQSQSPQLAATPGDDEPAAETEVEEVEQSDDTAGGAEEDEELPTLNEPEAEDEAAAEAPANLSGLLVGGFALLLAALLLWFILWRRRRATES